MPDSVDRPAPLRTSAFPAATTSRSIPNDPVVLASASWVTTPWCLMRRGARNAAPLGRGGGDRPDERGGGPLVEHDRVVVHVGYQLRPQLGDAFGPRRDQVGREQARWVTQEPGWRGQQRRRLGQAAERVRERLVRQHVA